jgi:tripartite-type tricarboxylate transporter receptor subunit TctC
MTNFLKPTRRNFIKGSAAAAGVAGLAASPFASAFGADFPSRNMSVYVPTAEGGGADRNFRAFSGVWKKYLNTNFEGAYYPGAAGRVGYEKYMGLASDDGHDLLFGNMGAEVLNWVVKEPTFNLDDLIYFAQLDADPGILFVSAESKLQNIDDIIAEGKKRTLNVGVSRLAHPASLGALAVARHTGAKFNLIPLSGGRNTLAGVTTGEMDFGALPSGNIVQRTKTFKTVLVFDDTNPLGERLHNAPTANDHLGMDLPPLIAGARAFAIKKAAIDKHPENFKILNDTLLKVFPDPDYKAAVIKAKAAWEYIGYGDAAACAKYAANITRIGKEFKDLLTGKT